MKLFLHQIIFKIGIQSENIVFEKDQNNVRERFEIGDYFFF